MQLSDQSETSRSHLTLWLAAWGVIWLAFYWPWVSGAVTIPWDGKAHFAPQIQFMAASIARGEWPFWTPNVFAGHPQIADPQSMLFSPPFVLLALFEPAPGPWVIDSVIFAMLLIAGVFVILFTRDLGWPTGPGLLAAIVFCFGAAMAWRLQHFGQVLSLAYLPPTLFFLTRALDSPDLARRLAYGALAGLIAAFIVLGRDQVGLLCLYILIAYTATRVLASRTSTLPRRLARAVPPLLVGGLVAVSLIVLPILFTLALAGQSNRPEISFEGAGAGSLHPALLLTAIAPNLYGAAGEMANYWGPPSFPWPGTGLYLAQNMGVSYIGAVPLLLLVMGTISGDLWQREIRFFSIAFVAVVIYALGWYTPAFRWAYEFLPGVSFYRRPADAVFLIGTLAAFLAAFTATRRLDAAHESAAAPRTQLAAAGLIVLALLGLAASVAFTVDRLPQALPVLGRSSSLVYFCSRRDTRRHPYRPHSPACRRRMPDRANRPRYRLEQRPERRVRPPHLHPHHARTGRQPANHRPPRSPGRSHQIAHATRPHRDGRPGLPLAEHPPHPQPRLDPWRQSRPPRPLCPRNRRRRHRSPWRTTQIHPPLPFLPLPLADLLGLRYIATGGPIEQIDKSLRTNPLPVAARTPDATIYENPGALPRVLFATRAISANFDEILRTGAWPTTDFETTVVLEDAPPAPATRRPGKIAIADYRNTRVTLSVDSPDGGYAILNDVWHPWWRAEIDAKPVEMLRANVLFRAVAVPPGKHTVTFRFTPLKNLLSRPTHDSSKVSKPDPS